MPDRQPLLRRDDGVGDAPLPLQGHAAEIGFVADFVVQVVVLVQGGDDFADEGLVNRLHGRVFERVDIGARHGADAVHVVGGVHGAEIPHFVLVEGAEENVFDHDAPGARPRHEIPQPRKIGFIPLRQVELGAAVGVTRRRAPRPRAEIAVRGGRQRVPLDVERPGRFAVHAREGARQVQPLVRELIEVRHVVEVEVEHGAVVLARRDQNRRRPPELEVARIARMEGKRLAGSSRRGNRGEQRQSEANHGSLLVADQTPPP